MAQHIYNLLDLKKIVHKPGHFPIHHSNGGEIPFLSLGQKIGLPEFQCILHVWYVDITSLRVRDST